MDDFLVRPFNPSEVRDRINLTLCRAMRALDANPLSKLPGNTSIIQRNSAAPRQPGRFRPGLLRPGLFQVLQRQVRVFTRRRDSDDDRPAHRQHHPQLSGHHEFRGAMWAATTSCSSCRRTRWRVPAGASSRPLTTSFPISTTRTTASAATSPPWTARATPRSSRSWPYPSPWWSTPRGASSTYGEVSSIAMGLKKKAKENPKSSYVIDRRQA